MQTSKFMALNEDQKVLVHEALERTCASLKAQNASLRSVQRALALDLDVIRACVRAGHQEGAEEWIEKSLARIHDPAK